MNLKRVWWVFKKDMYIFLTWPVTYLILAGFSAVSGFMFYVVVRYFAQNYARFGPTQGMELTQMIIRPFLSNVSFLMLLVVPLVAMRLMSEERKLGTIEFLMTAPIRTSELIFGKFLAGVSMGFLIYLSTIIYPLFLYKYGNPDIGPILSGYFGVLLLLMAFFALGLFASSVTSNQLVSAGLTFVMLLLLWIIGWISYTQVGSTKMMKIINFLSAPQHLEDFFKGIIDTKHILYFLTLTFFGLFLSYAATESNRWRASS